MCAAWLSRCAAELIEPSATRISRRRGQARPNRFDECDEIRQMVLENVSNDPLVDCRIAVNEYVSKRYGSAQSARQFMADPSVLSEQLEKLLIRTRLAQSFVGNDVRCNIDSRLDCYL